jgi:cell division protein FtsL
MKPGSAALLLLVVAAASSAIAVVYARQQNRRVFVELERLNSERDELNIEFGRLKIEQATWAEANRIEQLARASLEMTFPTPADSGVLHP